MSDMISRQTAISAICNACGKIDCDKMDKCEKLQLLPANSSEFPNNSDTISRQAAIDALPSAQPNLDEWCTDCKEYDHEKHCCPRFNRVIRDTLNEVEPMRKRGTWMHDKDDVLISGYCSCCGWESIIMETDVADMPFCPNCGADMRGEES